MPEIERSEVEQVCNQNDLARPEMTSYPAHDETKLKEIVQDVVAADIGATVEVVGVRAPEEADVIKLKDKNGDPVD